MFGLRFCSGAVTRCKHPSSGIFNTSFSAAKSFYSPWTASHAIQSVYHSAADACSHHGTEQNTANQDDVLANVLPPGFWEANDRMFHELRHEKDRANRKERIAAVKAELDSLCARMSPQQREAFEARLIALRRQQSELQQARVQQALQQGLRVVVDCSFMHHCTNEKEVRSLAKQIEAAMAFNRRSDRPVSLQLAAFVGSEVEGIANSFGARSWQVVKHAQPALKMFGRSQVVMLSPDAEQALTELDSSKVYCIGGIVDRSVQKGITRDFAEQHGIQARRLPVLEHAEQMGLPRGTTKSPVLNVSDVVMALVEYHRTGDWVQALKKAIPSRKQKVIAPKPKKLRRTDMPSGSSCTNRVQRQQ